MAKTKTWQEMDEKEKMAFYESNNIGGGFREVDGGARFVKDSELSPEQLKRVQELRDEMIEKQNN